MDTAERFRSGESPRKEFIGGPACLEALAPIRVRRSIIALVIRVFAFSSVSNARANGALGTERSRCND